MIKLIINLFINDNKFIKNDYKLNFLKLCNINKILIIYQNKNYF